MTQSPDGTPEPSGTPAPSSVPAKPRPAANSGATRTAKSGSGGEADKRGLPLWLPLAALIIAVLVAAVIVARIGGTLSALVSPPQPVLPPDAMLQSQGSDTVGNWWLYQTDVAGCKVAKLYKDSLGDCSYSPMSGCNPDGSGGPQFDVAGGQEIAECAGRQTVGSYSVMWRVNISVSTDPKTQTQTVFRIYRDG